MRRIALGLFAVLACASGCGPLANDIVPDGGGGGGSGDATAPVSASDSGAPVVAQDGGGNPEKDGGADDAASPTDSGAGDSAPSDSGQVVVDAGPACSEADAGWVAGAGISATGWAATASMTNPDPKDSIAAAFDGNLTTRWSTGQAQAGGEWFRLDLGQAQTISQVALFSQTDFPAGYKLELSADDVTYTSVATGHGAQPTAICFPAQSARYVKITQTGTSGSWFSIYELNVFH